MIYLSLKKFLLEEVSNTDGVEVMGNSIFFYPEFEANAYGRITFTHSIPNFKSIKDVRTLEPDTPINASGIIILEPDGRIWLRKVANNFGGYVYSFAKGKLERGFTAQQNAIKETFEEMGLVCSIQEWLIDIQGDTSITRFYLGRRIGGHPSYIVKQDLQETDYIVLTDKSTALNMLNRDRDKKILRVV